MQHNYVGVLSDDIVDERPRTLKVPMMKLKGVE